MYTETVTVTGDGVYNTSGRGSGSDVATQVGTYYWVVNYSGNAYNSSATEQISLSALDASLPTTASAYMNYPSGSSYWSVTLSNSNTGTLSGTYQDWCVDTAHTSSPGTTYSVDLFSTAGTTLPSGLVTNQQNFPEVNWILNQNFVGKSGGDGTTYTEGDVQYAIWSVLGLSFNGDLGTLGSYRAQAMATPLQARRKRTARLSRRDLANRLP